jgi:hypothetical protein
MWDTMWDTVLVLAVAAGLGPTRIATLVLLVSRAEPIRQPLTYLASGLPVTLAMGGTILFLIGYSGIGQSNDLFALLFAAAVGSGLAARVVTWWQSRRTRPRATDRQKSSASPDGQARSLLSRVPGFDRMPRRVQAELDGESLWIAGVVAALAAFSGAYLTIKGISAL